MSNFYASYPILGVPVYPTASALPTTGPYTGALAVTADTGFLYEWNGSAWAVIAGAGTVLSLGPFGSTPNANGLTLVGDVLNMQPADGTNPGGVSILAQTFAGVKTFSSAPNFSSLTASTGLQLDASKNVISATLGTVTESTSSVLTLTGWSNATFGSPTIQVKQSSGSQSGYLSSADWTTFNNKQNALTIGNLTDVGTDGITVTGGTGAVIGTGTSLSQHVADTSHNGYLSSTDWNTFNGKQAAGNYITALTGDVSATGPGSVGATLATVNSNTGTFGSTSSIPTFTVNSKGLITAASGNSSTATPTASIFAGWDANKNFSAVNLIDGYSTTATANQTTTLTVGSNSLQYFTGSTANQIVQMPVTSTLVTGMQYTIVNTSTQPITVNSSGGNLIQTMAANTQTVLTVINTGVTTAAGWNNSYSFISGGSVTSVAMTVPTFLSVSGSPVTTSGTLAVSLSGTALPVANGGTGQTTLTNHGVLVGAATSGITQLAAAAAGTVLTGQGTSSDPSFSATPTLGVNGTTTGQLLLATNAASGQSITVQNRAGTTAYNMNLPSSAGSSGQPLLSGGGGTSDMTYGTLGVAAGGTGQTSYTDGQLLIGNTSGNTLTKATLTAGSNVTITNGNGSITIASTATSGSVAWNYTAQSTTYNASINDYISASGASFTITLPSAASNAGKGIQIEHNGTSLSQKYTLNTTSSQTIGGVASGSYVLTTAGEVLYVVSDGSNWQIANHQQTLGWTSYTPSAFGAGFGTPTGVHFYYRRDGDNMYIKGYFTIGTIAGSLASFTIPSNTAINTTVMGLGNTTGSAGELIGHYGNPTTAANGYLITATGTSSSTIYFGGLLNGTSGVTPVNGSTVFNSSTFTTVQVGPLPISDWQP